MAEYFVSYMVVYGDTVEADSPEEAADMVADDCPFDIDGGAFVTNQDTGETFAITVIPISLWTVFVISRETDTVIHRCESMKRWAKRNLDEREGGQE